VKIAYKNYGQATVSAEMFVLLHRCTRLGWKGSVDGVRGGSRTYLMQKALWLLYQSGRGAPAFNPDATDPHHLHRHMRSNIAVLGGWSNAVDVSDPVGLIRAAARLGITLHRPYNPPETWHVEAVKPFKLKIGGDGVDQQKLVAILRAHGIVNPVWTIQAAKKAGLKLAYACACLEKETGGGHNVFGHDPTIFRGAGAVTPAKYAAYKKQRLASGNRLMQGVGSVQLTWWSIQDAADRLGGCWHPLHNMTVGFTALAALIHKYGAQHGAAAYNGSGPAADAYGRDFVAKVARWNHILS
jgi:hypothetical protein